MKKKSRIVETKDVITDEDSRTAGTPSKDSIVEFYFKLLTNCQSRIYFWMSLSVFVRQSKRMGLMATMDPWSLRLLMRRSSSKEVSFTGERSREIACTRMM